MTDLGEAGSLARETAPAKPAAGQAGLRIASASKDQVSIRHGHGSVLNRRNRRVRSPPESTTHAAQHNRQALSSHEVF